MRSRQSRDARRFDRDVGDLRRNGLRREADESRKAEKRCPAERRERLKLVGAREHALDARDRREQRRKDRRGQNQDAMAAVREHGREAGELDRVAEPLLGHEHERLFVRGPPAQRGACASPAGPRVSLPDARTPSVPAGSMSKRRS